MNSSLMNIIFILLAAAVGYMVGLLDKRVTANVKQKKEEKNKAIEMAKANEAAKRATVKPPAQLEETASNEHVALRVLVDPGLHWLIEVDGQRLRSDEISPEQRQRLVNVIVQIRPWIDGKAAPKSAPPSHPMPVAPTSTASYSPTAPRIDPIRGFRSMIENDGRAKKESAAPLISIVTLIDTVLQKQLESSPLANRGIKLEEGPTGDLLVQVDKERYSSIDEVPYPEIQAAIKNAIAEFNKGR